MSSFCQAIAKHCHFSLTEVPLILSDQKNLRPVLLVVRAGSDKNKSVCLQNKGFINVPKEELAYNSKSSNKVQKLPLTLINVLIGLKNKDVWKHLLAKTLFRYNFILPCHF